MLKQRIATGLVLAGLFLAAVFLLPLQWIALAFGSVAVLCGWEWAPLAGWKPQWARVLFAAVLGAIMYSGWVFADLAASADQSRVQPWIGGACLFWSLSLFLVKSYPGGTWAWEGPVARSVMGWLAISTTWLAIIYLLGLTNGPLLVVLLVVGVAAADIGAYFAGRRWGRHKLAPAVSPGKTWEGLWGGVVAVLGVTVLVWMSLPNAYAHLQIVSLVVMGLSVAGASVLGDLTVSMVKRNCGVKDTGSMLPGHGGLLDRIDSICGAAPVFTLGLMLMGY